MIERLNQIFLCDFIELSCGNNSVLLSDGDNITETELKERVSKLIIEYRNIADPVKMNALIADREEQAKEKANILLLRLCQSLISLNCYNEVREILVIMSYRVSSMTNEEVSGKIEELIRSALFEQKRNEDFKVEKKNVKQTTEQIRASFDSEIAFLMTHFKMNIDIHLINAAVYANIVRQACLELSRARK